MKTQIITLESHDDLISVRDRMSWAKSPRVLLVWPGYERVELRPIDLRILQERARYLGAELGLVTRQGNIRRAAQSFGIPVFRSTAEARRAWPSTPAPIPERRGAGGVGAAKLRQIRDELGPRRRGPMSGVVARIGSFIVGVLAVLTLAALFVPRATVTLTPVSQDVSLVLPIKASLAVEEPAISGRVPARIIDVTVSGTQSADVTSMAKVPQDKATGIAEFKNLTQTEMDIPAGTVVYSITPSAQRFATSEAIKLPGTLNATITAPIEAVLAGSGGNLPANAIQAMEGTIGPSVAVTNPDPTQGGTDRTTKVPSADDRARARQALVTSLEAQARDRMKGLIGQNDILLAGALKDGKAEEETYEPAAGDPGSLVTVKITMDFEGQYVKAEDLRSLAEGAVTASAPAGYKPAINSLAFSLAGTPTYDSGQSQFDLNIRCRLVRVLDLERAAALVRGYPPSAAEARLRAQFPLQKPPEVTINPSWWPWLPLIPFRITVTSA